MCNENSSNIKLLLDTADFYLQILAELCVNGT